MALMDPASPDPSLFAHLLQLPDGIFTRAEARRSSVADEVLTAACRRGALMRISRAVYLAPRPLTRAERRHLVARGALRTYPDAQLTAATAVAAHGVPLYEVPVTRLDVGRPVHREVLTQHLRIRPVRHDPVQTAWGPADPLAPALVQLAIDHGILAGMASMDAAMHARLVSRDDLLAARDQVARWPRVSRAACALAWSDRRAESLGESVVRAFLTGAGIAATPQVTIRDEHGGFVARVDLLVDGTLVVVEFDGKVKYTDGGPDALFEEKQREDRLRALGYIVVRFVWSDLRHPDRIVAAVRRAMSATAA